MVIIAGIFLGLAVLWPMTLACLRMMRDTPFGSIAIGTTKEQYDARLKRSMELQSRVYRTWLGLWPVALLCLIGAIVSFAAAVL